MTKEKNLETVLGQEKPLQTQQVFSESQSEPISKSEYYAPLNSKNKTQNKKKKITKKPIAKVNRPKAEKSKAGRKQSLWASHFKKRYWMFILKDYLSDPRVNNSWKQLKRDSFFIDQAKYIGGGITPSQAKVYDERQKKQWQKKGQTEDMLDTAVHKLMKKHVEDKFDQEVYNLLQSFNQAIKVKNARTSYIEEGESFNREMMNKINEIKDALKSIGENNDSIFKDGS